MSNSFRLIIMASLCGLSVVIAGTESSRSEQAAIRRDQGDELFLRLDQLHPNQPESYFAVGERLGASARTESELFLANQVLGVGIGLAQRQGDLELAASMCIALASFEDDTSLSSVWWDLALMLDPSRHQAWVVFRDVRAQEDVQLRQQAARCLYSARFSDPKVASALWGEIKIRRVIKEASEKIGLDPARVSRRLDELISVASDDECRGRVFVVEKKDGQMERVVCPDHTRPIGTAFDEQSLSEFIRIEVELLSPVLSSTADGAWELTEYLKLQLPANDPAFAQIQDHYRIELSKPYWRDGHWSASP